jgi:hypothetical protein
MAERTVPVEQLAEHIWLEWLNGHETMKIAKDFGYSPNPYGYYTALDEVEWGDLPDNVKDHIRDMAEKEYAIQITPPTEAAQYLITLFRELDRLRPAAGWSVASHGIIWDKKREKLTLLVNVGDAVSLYRLRPDELTNDPVATAASIITKAEDCVHDPDADIVMFKH